jgi:hypothetical protein
MDLFVTLNVATFKNIRCIPIVCKYLIFVVSMKMRGKNQSHVALHYLYYIYIKQSRVSYAIYNSRTAGQIFMIFILLDLSPPRLAE